MYVYYVQNSHAKDTLKAFHNFNNKQTSVWSNVICDDDMRVDHSDVTTSAQKWP